MDLTVSFIRGVPGLPLALTILAFASAFIFFFSMDLPCLLARLDLFCPCLTDLPSGFVFFVRGVRGCPLVLCVLCFASAFILCYGSCVFVGLVGFIFWVGVIARWGFCIVRLLFSVSDL